MLPVILIITDVWLKRKSAADKAPYVLLGIIFGLVALLGKKAQLTGLTILEHLLLSAKGTVFYLYKLILPIKLSVFHIEPYPIDSLSPELLIYGAITAVLIVIAVTSIKKRPILFFGIMFYLLMLIPTFATFWRHGFVYFASERYVYAAQFGILFMVSFILILNGGLKFIKKGGLVLGLVLIVLTMKQAETWKDGETLLRHTLRFNPDSIHALNNLGTTLYDLGKIDEALAAYDKAISLDPNLPNIYSNKGIVLLNEKRVEEAKKTFIEGIKNQPGKRPIIEDDLMPYFQLARVEDEQGNLFGDIIYVRIVSI